MAKKILSILCAIAMMVTMLSVAMVSVFAADPGNLGTVTREEKSFGSLAHTDNTFVTKNSAGSAQALFNYHSGPIRNTVTGDAIAVIGQNRNLTSTTTATYSLGNDFEFSFDYFWQNFNAKNDVSGYVMVGGLKVEISTMNSEGTLVQNNPEIVVSYNDSELIKTNISGAATLSDTEKETILNNLLVVRNEMGQTADAFVNKNAGNMPSHKANIKVSVKDGKVALVVNGNAPVSTDLDADFTNVQVSASVSEANIALRTSIIGNWSGSYFSEQYIEGDAGEGENTGYVSNIASGTDLLTPSTLAGTITESYDIGAHTNGVSNTVYAATDKKTKLTFDTYAFWSKATSDLSVVSSQEYNFGENFEVTATMIIINQQQGNNSSGYISLGDVKLSFDRPTGGATATDVIIKLTNGDTVLGTYTTQAAAILDSDQFTGSKLQENEKTIPNGTYTLKYENGLLSVIYRNQVLEFDGGLKTFEVDASAFNGVKFSVGVKSTARTSFIGNCVYTDNTVVEVDPYAPNIENGTDLLGFEYTVNEGAGATVGISKEFDTGDPSNPNNNTVVTNDNNVFWNRGFGHTKTITSVDKYNLGTNFEVSAYLIAVNQVANNNTAYASISLGNVKLTLTRSAGTGKQAVTVVLTNGADTLGTYTFADTYEKFADYQQFKEGKIVKKSDFVPNGTYTFKYDGTNLSVLFNGTAMTFDTGSSFPMDASTFSNINIGAGLGSNGRSVLVGDAIYTNLTPVVDKDLAFCGAGLTLGNGIGIEFYVNPAVYANYTDVVASVTYTGSETAETYTLKDLSGYKGFTFDKYSPDQYDEFVFVQLSAKKNGALVEGNTVKYSVANYISNQRKNNSANTKLMSVIDAMEEYCVAFDAYIDGEEYTYAGEAVELTKENDYHMNKATIDNPAFAFTGCTLNFREAPTVLYAFSTTEEVDNYTFKITKQDGSVATIAGKDFVAAGDGVYYVYYRGVTATEMRNTITGQMFNGDAAASDAITYSVVSYAYYQYQKAEKTILYDVTQAMMAYSDAVCEYAGK